MNIATYLDSTYLKTPAQSGLTQEQTQEIVLSLAKEAVQHELFAVMIRPEFVKEVKEYLVSKSSKVQVGTVIGFHEGDYSIEEKLKEAKKAIEDGADELDFVINYNEYKNGNVDLVSREFIEGSKLALGHSKIVKWIIEIAALTSTQIAELTALLSSLAQAHFSESERAQIFVKSSTGFFKTPNGEPNGATVEGIKLMKENAGDLPIKAAGGVRSSQEAKEMIELGVTRIGTSSALALLEGKEGEAGY
ncbi:deoxyribose-phosphate aldolase [Chryseobacterium sp. A301]